nr:hypothetical protein CFP56_16604 [Quercus suber]
MLRLRHQSRVPDACRSRCRGRRTRTKGVISVDMIKGALLQQLQMEARGRCLACVLAQRLRQTFHDDQGRLCSLWFYTRGGQALVCDIQGTRLPTLSCNGHSSNVGAARTGTSGGSSCMRVVDAARAKFVATDQLASSHEDGHAYSLRS